MKGTQQFAVADEEPCAQEAAREAENAERSFVLKAMGHPVSGGRFKPTYLTSTPLRSGQVHIMELKVKAKKRELRVGMVSRSFLAAKRTPIYSKQTPRDICLRLAAFVRGAYPMKTTSMHRFWDRR